MVAFNYMFNEEELETLRRALTDGLYSGSQTIETMLAYAKLHEKVSGILREKGKAFLIKETKDD